MNLYLNVFLHQLFINSNLSYNQIHVCASDVLTLYLSPEGININFFHLDEKKSRLLHNFNDFKLIPLNSEDGKS